jgi:transcription antitermination factor NusG
MPILTPEPHLFPSGLFDTAQSVSSDRAWWVLHTKPRQEKSLARQLHCASIPFFLPLIPRRSWIRNRPVTSYLPLFTSYVFLFADPQERITALSTSRVVNSIQVADQVLLARDLAQVYRLIGCGASITVEDRLVAGAKVEIQSGPLIGLRGRIVNEASRKRFIVEVDFIQRGASVTLDASTLVPINE